MPVDVTLDTICVILEDNLGQNAWTEDLALKLIDALALLGNDLLDHLDPPVGLKRWLESHGLSLVETREVSPPAVWGSIDSDDDEEDAVQEGEPGESLPFLEVGGFVEYRTAPSGPRGQSQMGSGRVISIAVNGFASVFTGPGQPVVWVDPRADFIRPVTPPGAP